MATNLERATAIATAILNKPASPAQIGLLVESHLGMQPSEVEGMTNGEKLARFIERTEAHARQRVKSWRIDQERAAFEATIAQQTDADLA